MNYFQIAKIQKKRVVYVTVTSSTQSVNEFYDDSKLKG